MRARFRAIYFWRSFFFIAFLCCGGCTAFHDQRVVPLQFNFERGGSAQYFYMEKTLPKNPALPSVSAATYLFVVSGADCASLAQFLPRYFEGLEGESGDVKIYILQKRFISAQSRGNSCSKKFVEADYPAQWIADQLEFIQQKIAVIPISSTPARIVILGVSEGAEIAPILAKKLPAVSHLVLLSNGGLSPIDALILQRKKNHAPLPDFLGNLNKLGENYRAYELGRTWKYWHQIAQIQQMDNLLSLNIPILMAMGEADAIVPYESALYARRQFELQGRTNLKVLIYPDADHKLESGKGSFMPNFFHQMDLWLGM